MYFCDVFGSVAYSYNANIPHTFIRVHIIFVHKMTTVIDIYTVYIGFKKVDSQHHLLN